MLGPVRWGAWKVGQQGGGLRPLLMPSHPGSPKKAQWKPPEGGSGHFSVPAPPQQRAQGTGPAPPMPPSPRGMVHRCFLTSTFSPVVPSLPVGGTPPERGRVLFWALKGQHHMYSPCTRNPGPQLPACVVFGLREEQASAVGRQCPRARRTPVCPSPLRFPAAPTSLGGGGWVQASGSIEDAKGSGVVPRLWGCERE